MSSASADTVVENSGTTVILIGTTVEFSPPIGTMGTVAGGIVGVFFLTIGGGVFILGRGVVAVLVLTVVSGVVLKRGAVLDVSGGIERSS